MAPPKKGAARFLDESKYFKTEEVMKLMEKVGSAWADQAAGFRGKRDTFLIEFGLSTGLRVSEMTDLACGDLQVMGECRSVVVRRGKGKKRRVVRISEPFKERCVAFLETKGQAGEPTGPDAPVFYSSPTGRGITRRGLLKIFKRVVKQAGLGETRPIHALRHTYGTQLCRASGNNLRLVQRQMGHDSIETTAIYLHVESHQMDEAVERLSKQLSGEKTEDPEAGTADARPGRLLLPQACHLDWVTAGISGGFGNAVPGQVGVPGCASCSRCLLLIIQRECG
jgi:site-specific recombinase XerD